MDNPVAPFLADIPLVDAHHHFWELDRFPYGWLAPDAGPGRFGDKASLRRDYLVDTYLAEFGNLPLSASVHVQANCGAADPADETRWLQSLSDTTGWPNAIIAQANLLDSDAAALVERHLAFAAVRGIRTPVAWDKAGRWRDAPKQGVLRDEHFRKSLSILEDNNLCLEIVVTPEQLSDVAKLAQAHTGLTIVIDHFGTLELTNPATITDWKDGISTLGETPNVYVKLSGMWTVARDWEPATLAPYVNHLITTLGPDRVMYGSNLPVEAVNCSLATQFKHLGEVLKNQPKETIEKLFSATARRVYRLT